MADLDFPKISDYSATSRYGQMFAAVEADFERQLQMRRATIEVGIGNLPIDMRAGVERAYAVISSNFNKKLDDFRVQVSECERLHGVYLTTRRAEAVLLVQDAATPAITTATPGANAFSGRKKFREHLQRQEARIAALRDAATRLADTQDAFYSAIVTKDRLRYELSELVNSAAIFVAEQMSIASRLADAEALQSRNFSIVRAPAAPGLPVIDPSRANVADLARNQPLRTGTYGGGDAEHF